MSKHLSKEFINKLNKEEFEEYYYSHMPSDTMNYFEMPSLHVLRTVVDGLGIKRMTSGDITKLQFKLISNEDRKKRSEKISKGHTGQKRSAEAREHMKIAQSKLSHSHLKEAGAKTRFSPNREPWNKGKKGAQKWTPDQAEKRLATMRKNNSFNISKQEDDYHEKLCEKYGKDNIIRQYKDNDRYPYMCDFYITTEDLFIEFNRTWTHGGHPFNSESEEDKAQLSLWENKAQTSGYYKNAIYTWTDLDVRKAKSAKENNLNYQRIY